MIHDHNAKRAGIHNAIKYRITVEATGETRLCDEHRYSASRAKLRARVSSFIVHHELLYNIISPIVAQLLPLMYIGHRRVIPLQLCVLISASAGHGTRRYHS